MSDRPIFVEGAAASPEALKERAALGLERAHGFVLAHATPLARCRGECLLEAAPAEDGALAVLALQCEDGSFGVLVPHRAEVFEAEFQRWQPGEALLGSLDALGMLSGLRQLGGTGIERTVAFVEGQQRDDGSFGEAHEAEFRLAGTGLLGGLLARTRYVRPACLAGIARFLGAHWDPSRVEGGRDVALSGYASFFTNVRDDQSDAVLQWCGRELERGFRTRRLEACALLSILLRCDVAMLPGATLAPDELLDALLGEQAGDGGFAALEPGGPGARVEPTLDAIDAIVRLCRGF